MNNRILLAIGTLFWVASACVPADDIDPPVVTSTQAVTSPVRVEPSPSVTNTQTQTTIPTMTFVPALPADEAEMELLAFLQDNGDCRLPCFWGIMPGETSASTAISRMRALRNLALYDYLIDEIGGGLGLIVTRNALNLQTHLIIEGYRYTRQNDKVRYMRVDFSAFEIQADVYQFVSVFGDPRYNQLFHNYTLPSILTTYGPPENAYIFYEYEMGAHEYYLLLDYTSSGWIARLEMPLYMRDGLAIGCPAEAFASFWLWHPDNLEAAREFGFLDGHGYFLRTIEEATSMTMAEFYRTFSDPANTACLEMPTSIYEP